LPDLTPLDFYLWGQLKTFVYATPFYNEGALNYHTVDACQTICNYTSTSEQMLQSMMRHAEACTESHG
jgi:hypothetical protein